MKEFRLEIEYLWSVRKNETPRKHWMYFSCTARDYESAVKKAESHYKTQVRDCGWTKWATLHEIRTLRNGKEAPIHIKSDDLSSSRSSTGNSGSTSGSKKRGTVGSKRAKRTAPPIRKKRSK